MREDEAYCPACGQPAGPAGGTQVAAGVPSMTPVVPAEAPAIRTAYAGFWLRLVAWMIDSLILTAAFLIVLVPLVPVFFRHRPFEQPVPGPGAMIFVLWFWGLNLVGIWLYFALFESSTWQATPGKRALSLFVTDMQGRRISFARATGRYFGKILSSVILFIGYFMAGFTERKQALHDILADCLVLRRI
jgi:uncharacterized RDD family membrane protein YckC